MQFTSKNLIHLTVKHFQRTLKSEQAWMRDIRRSNATPAMKQMNVRV